MKRILVVDDEYDISLTIKVFLEENGFIVDSFNDASQALENLIPVYMISSYLMF
jgi:DNA-binding response OmpR family regulator